MKKLLRVLKVLPVILFLNTSFLFSQTLPEKLDAVTDSLMTATKIPGMIVSLVCGDFKWEKAKGFADVYGNVPMTLDKTFRIGSVTKTFTITTLLQLVDEGLLKLDDPVNKYFDNIPNGDRITVRMLAEMTSGLYNYSDTKDFEDSLTNNPHKRWKNEELLEMAFRYPVYFEPNTDFHYSNTNTILIGMIIEKLTGKTIGQNITERIINKLGLKNTYVPENYVIPGDYAHGYNNIEDSITIPYVDVTEMYDPSWAGAAGDIISNVNDLKIYIRAMAKNQLYSPQMQAERMKWTPFIPASTGLKYGLGMFEIEGSYIGHNGGIPGFANVTAYSPVQDCSIIVMYNAKSKLAADPLAKRILQIMNGN
ncbi:MAG TPA: serine hydrolase domain-containing protein [Ignavibacteria bacterium]|nr:serine hydrolase domain-containing protein [Ignavibacteria bacterium]